MCWGTCKGDGARCPGVGGGDPTGDREEGWVGHLKVGRREGLLEQAGRG